MSAPGNSRACAIFDIDERYTNVNVIRKCDGDDLSKGDGSNSFIYATAYDDIRQEEVRIKKFPRVFQSGKTASTTSGDHCDSHDLVRAKRIVSEIRLMKHLNGHENLVQIYKIIINPSETSEYIKDTDGGNDKTDCSAQADGNVLHTPSMGESSNSCSTKEFNEDDDCDLNNFVDVYVVMSLFETHLSDIIASEEKLSTRHIQFFLYQILRALKFIHSAGIVHGDINPSKIVVDENCDVALDNFELAVEGSNNACQINTVHDEVDDVVDTGRHHYCYCAPELSTKTVGYTRNTDIWNVGCVFADLICRKLFPKCELRKEQMCGMFEILDFTKSGNQMKILPINGFAKRQDYIGSEDDDKDENRGESRDEDEDKDKVKDENEDREEDKEEKEDEGEGEKGKRERTDDIASLKDLFSSNTIDPRALDLLSKMINRNPQERISAHESLRHPFLRQLHERMDEPECSSIFSIDLSKTSMSDLQSMIISDMALINSLEEEEERR